MEKVRIMEPQDDGEMGECEEDLGLDLLARARLLCQAANDIALPMLQQLHPKVSPPKGKPKLKASRPSTREEDETKSSKPMSQVTSREKNKTGVSKPSETLPPIAASLPELSKVVKPLLKKVNRKKGDDEETTVMPLPQIHATDEWRKQREVEKIRQAQERAKARVVRKIEGPKSNQQAEEQPPEAEVSKQRMDELSKVNRRRALERVKLHKLEVAEEQAKAAAAKEEAAAKQHQSDELVKKAEAFRHRTLQRLQAAKREAQTQEALQELAEAEASSNANQPEESEEMEKHRKRLEKQRRRETAERVKRQQQIAEEQQRKEQELFEKGLNEFKTKKKEQDRVAKGFPLKRPSIDPVVVFEPANADSSAPVEVHTQPLFNTHETLAQPQLTTGDDESPEIDPTEGLMVATEGESPDVLVHNPLSETATTKPQAKKVPSWKQPPVPILPAECYTHKAVVSPSDSYTEKFQLRTGRSSPTTSHELSFSPPQRHRHQRTSSATKALSQTTTDESSP